MVMVMRLFIMALYLVRPLMIDPVFTLTTLTCVSPAVLGTNGMN